MSVQFKMWDLPGMDAKLANWWADGGQRVEVHRGVLIYVTGDEARLKDAIDDLPAWAVERLSCAGVVRGTVSLLWSKAPPAHLADGGQMNVPDGDVWIVNARIL